MTGPAALLVAGLATMWAGCPRTRTEPAVGNVPVDYVRRSFESTLAGCTDPATGVPGPCVRIAIEYVEPTRATVALARAVDGLVAATVLAPVGGGDAPADVEELRDALYEAYRDLQHRIPGYGVPWVVERTLAVACNTARLQGLVFSERSSAAGAPAIERVRYRTLDTETGERVSLAAIAAPEDVSRLTAELAQRARGARGAGDVFRRDAGEAADAEEIAVPDDLLVCPDAITFRWRGAEVVVPRGELGPLLRPDAP